MAPLSQVFAALSDRTRREILCLLSHGDMTAGEIADHFTLSKPSISHHLNTLKQCGLVSDQRQGQHIIYSLETTVFHDVLAWVLAISQKDIASPAPDHIPDGGNTSDRSA
jgi:ArsR family transcriptional regulator